MVIGVVKDVGRAGARVGLVSATDDKDERIRGAVFRPDAPM